MLVTAGGGCSNAMKKKKPPQSNPVAKFTLANIGWVFGERKMGGGGRKERAKINTFSLELRWGGAKRILRLEFLDVGAPHPTHPIKKIKM